MSANITAERSGTFPIGGQWAVHRLGFGSMRLTGRGIWGPPANPTAALSTLKRLPELGVNFIDTADSYGPDHAEEQIRAALHPYSGVLIATKAGLARTGPDKWVPLGRPEYLIQQAFTSCHRLGLEQIGLWQLHRIDPKVPRGEQFGAVKHLIDSGIIRHAGLSEVSVADIEEASKVFPVATVQNRYNLTDRHSEDARSSIARATVSVSSRGSRWQQATCCSRIPASLRSRNDCSAPRDNWHSPGCSDAVPADPADSWNLQSRSSAGKCRRCRHRALGSGLSGADRRRLTCPVQGGNCIA